MLSYSMPVFVTFLGTQNGEVTGCIRELRKATVMLEGQQPSEVYFNNLGMPVSVFPTVESIFASRREASQHLAGQLRQQIDRLSREVVKLEAVV
jgi:hypothetical protein